MNFPVTVYKTQNRPILDQNRLEHLMTYQLILRYARTLRQP